MPEIAHSAVAIVGIDIGKNSFHVVGLDQRGAGRVTTRPCGKSSMWLLVSLAFGWEPM